MAKPIDLYIRQQQTEIRDSLNRAFDFGWDACRERVIKLLEADEWHDLGLGSTELHKPITKVIHLSGCLGCRQIALIKGEK